ncbi:cyclic nucleotide-binding domain-containing protein [Chitinophaga horti]|uniref:Cyclic nucleotide-binding domain-containing protein n=1 Tax=Chitinophaga horti TaxID=2920382 RepID=A0ABY6J8W2_9BACT|nr:cyclic nucleotide-binding domain-containing protein [Chitinophaga horti]UYQ94599.1 cyclic nucleotide-binding domain-containing protein [Chitinophaga horti]
MTPFTAAIHTISPLSPATIAAFDAEVIHMPRVQRYTQLLEVGDVARQFFYLQRGLARVYYYHKGVDVTDYFAIDQQFIGGVESLFTGQASKKAIQVLENSDVYAISSEALERLSREYHEVERAGRRLVTFAFLEGQRRIESIRFHEAKERYRELDQKYPGLLNRAPLKYVASYLGITPVSLSRLRSQLD